MLSISGVNDPEEKKSFENIVGKSRKHWIPESPPFPKMFSIVKFYHMSHKEFVVCQCFRQDCNFVDWLKSKPLQHNTVLLSSQSKIFADDKLNITRMICL